MILVSRHQNLLDFRVGIEIDMTSVQALELTYFLRGGRRIHCFRVCIEINLVFAWRHRNLHAFRVGIELTRFE